MQKIMPLTDLQRTAGSVLADLSSTDESVVITHRGRPAAVLISVARYQAIEADLERLDELELVELVREARQEHAAGEMIPHHEVVERIQRKFAPKQKNKRRAS
ncbi:MAG: type II toxin-antitoxin system Phd/YefM family antitoxin [Pyrinomonadaceae bacterium]